MGLQWFFMLFTHSFGYRLHYGLRMYHPRKGFTSFLAFSSFFLRFLSVSLPSLIFISLLFSVVQKFPLVPLNLISPCYRTFLTANETVATPVRLVYPSTLYSLILNSQFLSSELTLHPTFYILHPHSLTSVASLCVS